MSIRLVNWLHQIASKLRKHGADSSTKTQKLASGDDLVNRQYHKNACRNDLDASL